MLPAAKKRASKNEDDPLQLGGELRFQIRDCRTYCFDRAVYLVDVNGKLTLEELRPTIDSMYRDPVTRSPHAVIFREGPSATYHSSVLTFYQYDVKRPMPVMLGIVACRAGTRMVATAVGLGYRAITGVPLIVYDNLVPALTDARAAVRAKIR